MFYIVMLMVLWWVVVLEQVSGLHGVIRWYKLILRELIDLEVRIHYA